MITDIFARRYERVFQFNQFHAEQCLRPLCMQAAHIFFGDLQTVLRLPESFYGDIHARLARELGLPALSFEGDTQLQMCAKYLAEPFDLWNDAHRGADYFVRTRLSLLELLFRGAEELVRKDDAARHPRGGLFARIVNGSARTPTGEARSAVSRAIEELNLRLQACGIGFTYHNGLLQVAADDISNARIAKPFWEIVADPKWAVVDQEMKEACDRLDRGQSDAVTYATAGSKAPSRSSRMSTAGQRDRSGARSTTLRTFRANEADASSRPGKRTLSKPYSGICAIPIAMVEAPIRRSRCPALSRPGPSTTA
jgi:AbiJ N-terminal domain 4